MDENHRVALLLPKPEFHAYPAPEGMYNANGPTGQAPDTPWTAWIWRPSRFQYKPNAL